MWTVGALTALLVVFLALALSRAGRDGLSGGLARVALIVVGAAMAWLFLEGTARQDLAAERRGLEARAGVLAQRATMPGSPLACLDALAGDAVERSCERTLFASPEAMASAVSYVTAQLGLFVDVSELVRRGNAELEPLLAGLRRAVEADRYGLVAHVLATRDGCSPEQCPTVAYLQDARRVNANLVQRTYEFYVARHSAIWPAPAPGPTAGAAPSALPPRIPGLPAAASAFAAPNGPAGPRPGPGLFFPSADSIPPVNIMTSEPEPETTGSAPARTPRRPAQAPAPQPKQATPSTQAPQSKQATPSAPTPMDLNAAARGASPVTAQ
jgi:hypothetical protein